MHAGASAQLAAQNLVLLPQVIMFQGQVAAEQLLNFRDQRVGPKGGNCGSWGGSRPFTKFKLAVTAPAVEFKSPGTLKLVTPPITLPGWPSVSMNYCASHSLASMTPLGFTSMNFWTTTVSRLVKSPICSVTVPA
jgi:hypothetical protein